MDETELDSFSKGLELYLVRLDEKYKRLREIAADPLFLNRHHQDYKSAWDKFEDTLDNIFELKEVWYEARSLVEK